MRALHFRGIRWLSCLLSVALAWPVAAESASDVADSLRAGNRVALEGIRTLHAKMRSEGAMKGMVHVSEVECWRRGKDARQKQSDAQHTVDIFRLGGRQTSITVRTEANGSKLVVAMITPTKGEHGALDPWEAALCVPSAMGVPLADLLAGEHTLESAEYKGTGAKRRGRLSVKSPEGRRLVITIDPTANYMIEKVESYATQDFAGKRNEIKSVREVVSFGEVAPGIFFPKKVMQRNETNGNVMWSSVVTFSDVIVNQPLPAGVFTLRFPRNVEVTDRIANTTYQADEQGRPISAVKKLGVWPSIPPPDPSKLIPPTLSEADPWAWWPYAWVAGAAGVGALAWVARRRRAAGAG